MKISIAPVLIASTLMSACAPSPGANGALKDPTGNSALSSLLKAERWLNTRPLRTEDLRGKVVVVNFWTFSCINSLRALPYVRAWSEKYKSRGLVVIGVQTPEFAFEKDTANVQKSLTALGVDYPVAIDNDYGIWNAFNNDVWPALYFIDANGRVRHQALGEGDYEQSERVIQQLLSEANGSSITDAINAITGKGPQAPADEDDIRSPETYVGYAEGKKFSSPESLRKDAPHSYQNPPTLDINHWSLGGIWTIGSEFTTLQSTPGSIVFAFHARDLNLVMTPPADGSSIRFKVTIDGAKPAADHGVDVDADGAGVVKDARMYQLVRQTRSVKDRIFKIQFLDPGVRAYVFTFG